MPAKLKSWAEAMRHAVESAIPDRVYGQCEITHEIETCGYFTVAGIGRLYPCTISRRALLFWALGVLFGFWLVFAAANTEVDHWRRLARQETARADALQETLYKIALLSAPRGHQ